MRRSSKWTRPLAVAVLIAVVGLLLPAGHAALAVPLQQTSAGSQIVYLDGNGQLVVNIWQDNTRSMSTVWRSPSNGWSYFVLGDFNGDGKKEIAATKGNMIGFFNPVSGSIPLPAAPDPLPSGSYHLMAAGDFQKKGYDQLAVTYTYADSSNNFHEIVQVYDPGTNWAVRFVRSFPWDVQTMTAGDVNRDGYSDLSIAATAEKWFIIISGQDLVSELWRDYHFCCNWLAVVVGDVDKDVTNGVADHPGNEIVQSRDSEVDSLLLGWWKNTTDPIDFARWSHYPAFYSLALGDVDDDPAHDQEVLGLRDPGNNDSDYLVLRNLSGPEMAYELGAHGDYGDNAWRQVAAGDLNGDTKAEVAIVRWNELRIFYQPSVGNQYQPFPGTYWPDNPQVAIGDLGFGSGALVVSPQTLTFNFAANQYLSSSSQTLQVGGGGATLTWSASLEGNTAQWLTMDSKSGTTPSTPRVTVSAQAAGVGSQKGTIRFQGRNGTTNVGTVDVAVTVNVADPGLLVNLAAVTFLRAINDRTVPPQATVNVQLPNFGSSQAVKWTATAIANTTAQQFLDKMAKDAVQSKNGSVLIDGVAAATADWVQISPPSGQLTPSQPSATTNLAVDGGKADMLGAGAHQQAVVVFLTNPYRADWVRTVEVDLAVTTQVRQTWLPIVPR